MFADLTTALSGIKALSEFLTLVSKSKTDAAVTAKAIELQSVIISLQSMIAGIQAENHDLLQQNHALKQELISVKNWEAEATKYELSEIAARVFVHTIKSDQRDTQPDHWLCANCYEKRQKSVLQRLPRTIEGYPFYCPSCKTTLVCWPTNPEAGKG